jgi:hypothetical protein
VVTGRRTEVAAGSRATPPCVRRRRGPGRAGRSGSAARAPPARSGDHGEPSAAPLAQGDHRLPGGDLAGDGALRWPSAAAEPGRPARRRATQPGAPSSVPGGPGGGGARRLRRRPLGDEDEALPLVFDHRRDSARAGRWARRRKAIVTAANMPGLSNRPSGCRSRLSASAVFVARVEHVRDPGHPAAKVSVPGSERRSPRRLAGTSGRRPSRAAATVDPDRDRSTRVKTGRRWCEAKAPRSRWRLPTTPERGDDQGGSSSTRAAESAARPAVTWASATWTCARARPARPRRCRAAAGDELLVEEGDGCAGRWPRRCRGRPALGERGLRPCAGSAASCSTRSRWSAASMRPAPGPARTGRRCRRASPRSARATLGVEVGLALPPSACRRTRLRPRRRRCHGLGSSPPRARRPPPPKHPGGPAPSRRTAVAALGGVIPTEEEEPAPPPGRRSRRGCSESFVHGNRSPLVERPPPGHSGTRSAPAL